MISIIIPINHKDRVNQLNRLYDLIKKEAGLPVEIIVACDNPDIFDLLKYDKLVKIPYRLEFTHSVNLAAEHATYDVLWYMDDSVTPVKGWAKEAYDAFYKKFPDGMGIMEISGATNCATRCLTTKTYAFGENMGFLLWPEYLHCGDTEHYERAIKTDKFYSYPKTLLKETKINDESRKRNMKVFKFDDMIRDMRRGKNFAQTLIDNWDALLYDYCKEDEDLMSLYNNLMKEAEVEVIEWNK